VTRPTGSSGYQVRRPNLGLRFRLFRFSRKNERAPVGWRGLVRGLQRLWLLCPGWCQRRM